MLDWTQAVSSRDALLSIHVPIPSFENCHTAVFIFAQGELPVADKLVGFRLAFSGHGEVHSERFILLHDYFLLQNGRIEIKNW